ncbi:DUF4179 domain-containing protein [Clostridium tagluense]|uniref:DUF4179 domain-containing protein n=1 Tax=Clostridium tagluense TaxID=360422 RepID=UPI001C6E0B9C|nr:DUF4179 domain-containing protein [Clostridium tagluense]MBW9157740.1 DUF4179 domain-containing protein [Clostridium tagluense]WLC66808.1 DUF4179 domain-containing protein [Clostridium tagluense]
MNEKEIFNIVDNISEENLSMIMGKADINIIIENSVGSYKAKEIIRAKLHGKIKQGKEVRAVSQENIINNKEIVKLEDTESLLKRESKKGKRVKENKVINNIIKSVVAAMFVFVVSVNIFPDLALALVKIPGLNKLIEIVTFDKGFKNVIDNGNIQYVNTIIEDKGVKFTVNTIAGDDLKLWIGYELEGEGSILGEIKFKNKADGKDLPWMAISQDESKNYIEVNMDSLVKDFEMKIDVYKNDVSFHTPLSQLDEKAISDVKQLFEKSKITTLSVPISLNNKIYNKDLRVLNIRGKEFKSEIGIFKIEKLELSKSRSIIYFKLLSEENELLEVLVPRLVDGEGKDYSKSYNGLTCSSGNNMICVELSGGIKSVKGLSFKCNGFKYTNKKDKNITIDLKNKQIEYNVPRGFDMKVVD